MTQLPIMTPFSSSSSDALQVAAESLVAGNLVAFPTETVYGLGGDACNEEAVARIYEVKGRPINHPVIVHISTINNLHQWAKEIPDYAVKLAKNFWPGPMTLILPRTALAKDFLTGGQESIGIRVPANRIALELLRKFEAQGGCGVAAPSANRFGKVSPTSAADVFAELGSYLNSQEIIINGGRTRLGVESTIIDCTKTEPTILRPGGIYPEAIEELLSTRVIFKNFDDTNIRTSGLLKSHYQPDANVFLFGTPETGDGLIALSKVKTPDGVIRIAKPDNLNEFAYELYSSLRLADKKKICNVFVVPPENEGIGIAINDRLNKLASYDKN